MKRIAASALTALISLTALAPQPVRAEAETTLTIASWAPPTHVANSQMWPAFIERLEEITDGRVTAEVKLGLAPPPAMADLVLDGAADITYIFHGYNPGRFVTAQLAELPGVEGTAEAVSAAYWDVWRDHLAAAGEQREFKTLAMFTHGPAQLHLADPISGLADVEGLKLRSPGGVGAQVLSALGGIGIQVPATKVYETLSARAADGVTMNVDSRLGFKLDEVAPVMFELPGGLYRGSFAVLMNRDRWEALPEDIREKLDAELVGAPLSRLFGKLWDGGDAVARESTQANSGPILAASEADLALFAPIVAQAREEVLARIAEKGIDAAAAKAQFDRRVAQVMAETGDGDRE